VGIRKGRKNRRPLTAAERASEAAETRERLRQTVPRRQVNRAQSALHGISSRPNGFHPLGL
jgi:hypothetical protein